MIRSLLLVLAVIVRCRALIIEPQSQDRSHILEHSDIDNPTGCSDIVLRTSTLNVSNIGRSSAESAKSYRSTSAHVKLTNRSWPTYQKSPAISYNDAECRGDSLLALIEGQKGRVSQFDNYGAIAAAGYEDIYLRHNEAVDDHTWSALDALKIPWSKGWVNPEYFLRFNYDKGAMIMQGTWSEYPVMDPSVIHRASDIIWLAWRYGAEQSHKSYKDLKYYLIEQCFNRSTRDIANKIIEDLKQPFGQYPGITLRVSIENPTDVEFEEMKAAQALLGSPNGIALGWILVDRQSDLNWKTVKTIQIFGGDANYPNLIFTIGHMRTRKRDLVSIESGNAIHAMSLPNAVPKRADEPVKSYSDCLCSGESLLGRIAAQSGKPPRFGSYDDFKKFGYTGLDWDNVSVKKSMNTGDTKDDVDFSFRFSVESGAMVTWTFHVAKKIPNDQLKQLNDIAWLIWQDRAKTLKLDVGNIKYYIIPDISNTPCRKPATARKTYSMTSDEGKALLGTPNGVAIAWILIYNVSNIPKRTVDSVTVFTDDKGKISLCFNIGDIKATGKRSVNSQRNRKDVDSNTGLGSLFIGLQSLYARYSVYQPTDTLNSVPRITVKA
ncbi:MAG: hypothetical protein MMC23_003615 [Stictis urceolatum]|nr:hypothetical protein [Stictis urceolata]